MLFVRVPTWSANSLDTAWASVTLGARTRVLGRCMMSVHNAALPPGPQQPKPRHFSIWRAHKDARRIIYYVWILTAMSYVWFGVTQAALMLKSNHPTVPCNGSNAYLGSNWNLLPDHGEAPQRCHHRGVQVQLLCRYVRARLCVPGLLDLGTPLH